MDSAVTSLMKGKQLSSASVAAAAV